MMNTQNKEKPPTQSLNKKMNQQPKRNKQLTPLLDAYIREYAKQNPQSGLLNLTDALKQANQHKEDN